MTARQRLLAMTATAALLALPVLAMAQTTPSSPPSSATPAPSQSAPAAGSAVTPPANPNPAAGTEHAVGGTAQTMPSLSPLNRAVDGRTLREGRRASKMIGAPVYNEAGESIGQVDDILIPRESGPPVAIISVGGFLGIGAKLVAVPYDNLRMGESRWTLPGATKESLNALPGFSYDSTNRSG
jgi:sporulation protein YlmC with PRC-barrel domain